MERQAGFLSAPKIKRRAWNAYGVFSPAGLNEALAQWDFDASCIARALIAKNSTVRFHMILRVTLQEAADFLLKTLLFKGFLFIG